MAPLEKIVLQNSGFKVTKVNHSEPYAAISPLRHELSQAGKTVLVTGGATGIGYAIARGFAQAGATTIIISSRRALTVATAASKLANEFAGKGLQAIGLPCDVASGDDVEALWQSLEKGGIVVDILVLNAGVSGAVVPILKGGIDRSWSDFLTNVRGHIHFTQKFYNQAARDISKKLALINVASSAIHDFISAAAVPNYALTKNSGALAIQQIARDVKPEDMQVVNFHPGIVWTPMSEFVGRDAYEWDSEDLAGHFAVWAASDEAKFLHGRFVWAAWDVEEMKSDVFRQKLDNDHSYLKIGVHGL